MAHVRKPQQVCEERYAVARKMTKPVVNVRIYVCIGKTHNKNADSTTRPPYPAFCLFASENEQKKQRFWYTRQKQERFLVVGPRQLEI